MRSEKSASRISSIPTVPMWHLMGHDSSGRLVYFDTFGTPEEAADRLRELESDQSGLTYELGEFQSIVPDRTMPTERQRRELCTLMHRAFVALRLLGYEKKHDVIADLADAFHNLPEEMHCEETWDWNLLEAELIEFERKHPDDKVYPFAELVREIRNQGQNS